MKRVLLALVVVLAVASMSVGGTLAGFCDTETSEGNFIETGSLDLKVAKVSPSWEGADYRDDQPWGVGLEHCFDVPDVTPCNSYPSYLKLWNAGCVDGIASLLLKVVSADPASLPDDTEITIWYDESEIYSDTLANLATGVYWPLGDLPGSEPHRLKIEVHPQSDGWLSGSSYLVFKTLFGLVQATGSFSDTEECYSYLGRSGEGCTPGYWKNHTDSWPTEYSPDQTVKSVFNQASEFPTLANDTLLQALGYGGGSETEGGARILLRAAVAAVLNASSEVDYPRSEGDVVNDVNDALASGDRATMIALANALDADNNLGCPF